MSKKQKAHTDQALYYMTCTVVGWIDIFTRESYRKIVLDSLEYCQKNKGLHLNAYVIMTNHIHLIGWIEAPRQTYEVLRDFKRHTANKVLEAIQQEPESRREWLMHMFKYHGRGAANREIFQFWQVGYHPVELWSDEVIQQKLRYLHENPVRQGLVSQAEHWRPSSACNYHTEAKGLLDIELWWPSKFITVR
jgi:putative transposase